MKKINSLNNDPFFYLQQMGISVWVRPQFISAQPAPLQFIYRPLTVNYLVVLGPGCWQAPTGKVPRQSLLRNLLRALKWPGAKVGLAQVIEPLPERPVLCDAINALPLHFILLFGEHWLDYWPGVSSTIPSLLGKSHSLAVPGAILPALDHLVAEPALKKSVWQLLQPVIYRG